MTTKTLNEGKRVAAEFGRDAIRSVIAGDREDAYIYAKRAVKVANQVASADDWARFMDREADLRSRE